MNGIRQQANPLQPSPWYSIDFIFLLNLIKYINNQLHENITILNNLYDKFVQEIMCTINLYKKCSIKVTHHEI